MISKNIFWEMIPGDILPDACVEVLPHELGVLSFMMLEKERNFPNRTKSLFGSLDFLRCISASLLGTGDFFFLKACFSPSIVAIL